MVRKAPRMKEKSSSPRWLRAEGAGIGARGPRPHGGSGAAVYQWIKSLGETGVAYDTNNPYVACSKESTDGFCGA